MQQSSIKSNKNPTVIDMFRKKEKEKSKVKTLLEFDIESESLKEVTPSLNGLSINNDYKTLMAPHKNNEFIPPNIIPQIITHHFPGSTIIHSFNETHIVCTIPVRDILAARIDNWEYNRPPDMARCPDIARYMYKSKKPVDTMFSFTYKNISDCFEVLDGIHRITALRFLKSENSKPLDFISCGEFGSNNDAEWIYSQPLLVNIRFNSILGDLIETFKTLNKSQTVPDIYIRDVAKEKRDIINDIANDWQIRFKKHFSSSANPIIGNTNRNRFVDLLDKIYDKYRITEQTASHLKQVLEDANTRISFSIPLKLSIDARVKCKESGCYLFIYKNDKLEDLI
jgi:hypothetical protein